MNDRHNGWIASLSNGETVFESPPVPGKHSAWQSLLRRLQSENLYITQMRLQKAGKAVVAYPFADGYVQAHERTRFLFAGKDIDVQGIGTVIGNQVFMCWMSENGDIQQDIRLLNDLRVHSTVDWQLSATTI